MAPWRMIDHLSTNFTLALSREPTLKTCALPEPANLSFFEAYFSNFIEGTEFEVEEAADIVFTFLFFNTTDTHGQKPHYRSGQIIGDRTGRVAHCPALFRW